MLPRPLGPNALLSVLKFLVRIYLLPSICLPAHSTPALYLPWACQCAVPRAAPRSRPSQRGHLGGRDPAGGSCIGGRAGGQLMPMEWPPSGGPLVCHVGKAQHTAHCWLALSQHCSGLHHVPTSGYLFRKRKLFLILINWHIVRRRGS